MKKQKKLLILAGAGIHSKVVEAAREMNIYTIVADYLENSPAKQIADEALLCDIFDIDTLVEFGKKNAIDGVICFCCDPAQRPAQQVAEALGLPKPWAYQYSETGNSSLCSLINWRSKLSAMPIM